MAKKLNTKITEMIGIEYPILLGAMEWLTTAELVAAVSNAGGLGVMSTAAFADAEELRAEIKKTKALTDKPFAVNMTLIPHMMAVDYDALVDVCIEEGIKVMETSGRAPEKYIGKMKAAGMKVIHKCTMVKHALKAQKIGCDAVIIDGCEAGGHIGENDIGSMILWPAAVDALDVPVIACGGVADGRALATALMMGCEGVTVGTRFFLSKESPAVMAFKEYLAANANEAHTDLVCRRFVNTCRLLNVGMCKKIKELELSGAPYEEVGKMMNAASMKHAFDTGDLENGIVTIGQSVGLIHEVLSVKEIVDNMVELCFERINKFAQ